MSPRSEGSEWVRREIIRAQQQAKTIWPLLLDGLPFFELNTTQHEDVTDQRMPTPSYIRRLRHLTSTAPPAAPDDPTAPDHGQTALRFWLDKDQRLLELQNWEPALNAYTQAVELDPNNALANICSGQLRGV